jgi:opacity protein-like surface antigen
MLNDRFLFAAGAVFAVSLAASAANARDLSQLMQHNKAHSGPYIAGFGGAAFPDDYDFSGPAGRTEFESDTGYTFGGAVGYRLPVRIFGFIQPRVELEAEYLDSDIGGSNLVFADSSHADGDLQAVFAFFNSYSELRFNDSQRLVPYIGGGIGAAFLDVDIDRVGGSLADSRLAGTDDTEFVGHVAAGVTYELSRHAEIYSEGRYFRVSNVGLDFAGPSSLVTQEGRIEGYSVLGGVRWRF